MPFREIRTELKCEMKSGFYAMQVLTAHDIGIAAYAQLQKMNKVKDENSRVTAEDDVSRKYQVIEKSQLTYQVTAD